MSAHSFKNADGTVNLDGVSNHLKFVKGKYAQNAKNYEANTGKKMGFNESDAEPADGSHEQETEPPASSKEVKEAQ